MPPPLPLTSLGDAERANAAARFAILRPFLEDGVPLTAIAQTTPHALRTLRDWVTRYRRDGLAGLVHQPRADRGIARRVTPTVEMLIEGFALQQPRPTAAHVHRQVARVAGEQGWLVPSYRTVAACIQHPPPAS